MEEQADPLIGRAGEQLRHGNPDGAIETLRRALSLEPDHAEAHSLLAVALVDAKRRHAARVEARAALALDPAAAPSHMAMGAVLRAYGDLRGAEAEYRRFLAASPESTIGHVLLAGVLRARNEPARARAELDRALELDASDPDTLAALADLERDGGGLDAAERWARRALAEDPEHEDALVAMGHVLLRRGRVEEARQTALAAVQVGSTGPAVHLLAQVKARQSWVLGLWWRWGALMERFGSGRQVLILTLLYIAYRFALLGLRDLDLGRAAELVQLAWLAFAAYTWFGPALFRRSLERELQTVALRPEF